MCNNADARLKTCLSNTRALRIVGLFRKTQNAKTFEQLKPILEQYMKEQEILSLNLSLKDGDFETVEPISHGEREMWVSMWLKGELTSKQLLGEIRDFKKYHFQTVAHGYGFDGFLREVEAWLEEKNWKFLRGF